MVKATGDNSKKKKRSMNSSTHQMSTTSKARKTKDDQATMGHNPTTKRKQEPMNRYVWIKRARLAVVHPFMHAT